MKILLGALALLLVQSVASPTGSVAGRLLSPDGTPAAEVRVAAMEADSASANPGALLSITKTDKDGRYRVENIPPGRYFIVGGLVDSPTFYPGASTRTSATTVQVLAGQTIEKVDFSMIVPLKINPPPVTFKVGGRLSTLAPSGTASLLMTSPKTGSFQTAVNPNGTFEFLNVPRGAYFLQSTSGSLRLPVAIDDRDIAGLVWGSSAEVRVSGKIVMPGVAPDGMPTGIMVVLSEKVPRTPQSETLTGRSMRMAKDGTFEFPKVTPGTYDILIETGVSFTRHFPVIVADKDILGLQFDLPYQLEIPGRVVVEGGSQAQVSSELHISFYATDNEGTSSIGITNDGSFRLRLREGKSQITLRNLPLGYEVKSMVSGAIDMLQNPITIRPGQKFEEIVLTLQAAPVKGVRVSGQVVGMPFVVTLTLWGLDAGSRNINTDVNPDRTFEFPVIPAGNYMITGRETGTPGSRFSRAITVGTDAISGLQIP